MVSATATSAAVTVPPGSGTVTVSASSVAGGSSHTASFTYGSPPAPPSPPATPPPAAPPPVVTSSSATSHGYWLVGSDGGIFTFGSAQFYGSTGSLQLQRPVVGIVPTTEREGYWLDASDGGIFAFGDAGFYGSIPGLGLHPAGSGLPDSAQRARSSGWCRRRTAAGTSWSPPTAACSPSATPIRRKLSRHRWLLGCSGGRHPRCQRQRLLGRDPDRARLRLRRCPVLGCPGPQRRPGHLGGAHAQRRRATGSSSPTARWPTTGTPAPSAARRDNSADFNPATAVFATSDGGGYWVGAANGAVENYGDAPNDGSMDRDETQRIDHRCHGLVGPHRGQSAAGQRHERGKSRAPRCTAKSMASAGETLGSESGGSGRLGSWRACS